MPNTVLHGTGLRRSPGLVLALLLVAGGAAACDGGASDSPSPSASPTTSPTTSVSPSPSQSPSPTTTPTATPTEQAIAPFGLDPRSGPAEALPTGPALLTDVRTGAHVGFSRVVFEFRGDGAPGWRVAYVSGPILADGSGLPVEVGGSAFLQVRMEPAAGYDTMTGTPTYTGPMRVPGPAPVVEVVRQGDFEGVVSWVIGVSGQQPFAAAVLPDPPRVVVDVATP